ncbi:MAG: hypothetical protein ACE5J3_07615 [Methanosarcinales archaeon]
MIELEITILKFLAPIREDMFKSGDGLVKRYTKCANRLLLIEDTDAIS